MRSRSGIRMKPTGILRVRDRKTGEVRWKYHRATRTPLPIDVPETSPEFIEAWLAAERGEAPKRERIRPAPGTIATVWRTYLKSDHFRTLKASYQQMMTLSAAGLIESGGHVPVAEIGPRHIRRDLERLAPHAAVKRLKVWRLIMRTAVDRGLIERDPTIDVRKPRTPKPEQHAPWTDRDVARFRARWLYGSPERVAFELLHWTGARISDMVRLGPDMVDREGWLEFRQEKTGGKVAVPLEREPPDFTDPLDLEHLHRALAKVPGRHATWLLTHNGKPRTVKSASQWFARASREAGNDGKTAHGLRVRRALELAHGGATAHQIGAWTGHESLQEIEHYARQADKRRVLSKPARAPSPLAQDETTVKTPEALNKGARNASNIN